MLKIAIVGNEEKTKEAFKAYLNEYAVSRGVMLSVRGYTDGAVMLAGYFEAFDAVIICIDGLIRDGIELAEKLRKLDMRVSIILASASASRAIDGYRVSACDYLLTPVREDRFFDAVDRAVSQCMRERNIVMLKCVDAIVNISTDIIYYIESNAHYLTYHTAKGEYVTRELMRTAEQLLDRFGFVRINHGYLVNIEYVSEVRGEFAEVFGSELKISRARKPEFLRRLEIFGRKRMDEFVCGGIK